MASRRGATRALTAIVLLGLAGAGVGPVPSAAAQPDRSRELLEALAEELNVPVPSLEIVNQAVATFPYLQQEITTAKVRHRDTNHVYVVSIEASGRRVDERALLAQDLAAKRARFGKLEPELHARLETLPLGEMVDVSVWIAIPDHPLRHPTRHDFETRGADRVREEMLEEGRQRQARLAARLEPIVEAIEALGAQVRSAGGLAPIISVRATADQIRTIEDRPDVSAVYLEREYAPLAR